MGATPEMRFLAQCLPVYKAACNQNGSVSPAFRWDSLIDLAGWHGMYPLLARHLLAPAAVRRPSEAVPAAILGQLRANQAAYVGRSVTQLAALVELQREFDRHKLSVVAWKGPSTGMLLYGSATLRESADLDFLFLESEVPVVLQITRRLGYTLLGQSESESKDIYILTSLREFTFGRKSDRVILEFHLQIMPPRFALWQDAREDIRRASTRLELGDVTLCLQRPEDLLVSLCAHATKHNWERLKWSADIAQFLHVYGTDVDWPVLLEDLTRTGKHLVVLLGVAVAHKIYGAVLPESVVDALQSTPKIGLLAEQVTDHVMSGERETSSTVQRKVLANLLCPRLPHRVLYTLRPMVELNYEDLYIPVHNRLLFFMNYLFRVFRLLRKYGPQRLATKTASSVRSVH